MYYCCIMVLIHQRAFLRNNHDVSSWAPLPTNSDVSSWAPLPTNSDVSSWAPLPTNSDPNVDRCCNVGACTFLRAIGTHHFFNPVTRLHFGVWLARATSCTCSDSHFSAWKAHRFLHSVTRFLHPETSCLHPMNSFLHPVTRFLHPVTKFLPPVTSFLHPVTSFLHPVTHLHFSVRQAHHILHPATSLDVSMQADTSVLAHSDLLTFQCTAGVCHFLYPVTCLHLWR